VELDGRADGERVRGRGGRSGDMRRLGASETVILLVQSNLSNTYAELGRVEKALSMERGVYSGYLKLNGNENFSTLTAALNYAYSLADLQRYEEAKSLMRKTTPVARRVLGEGHRLTLKMRSNYARVLYEDTAAMVDDLREAVTTLEDAERTSRRVLGGAHPVTKAIEEYLRRSRAALRARETPSPGGSA
jgi:hypothetical protein